MKILYIFSHLTSRKLFVVVSEQEMKETRNRTQQQRKEFVENKKKRRKNVALLLIEIRRVNLHSLYSSGNVVETL